MNDCMHVTMYVYIVFVFHVTCDDVLSLCVSNRMDGLPSTGLLGKATSGPSRFSWTGGQTSRPDPRYSNRSSDEKCMYVVVMAYRGRTDT